MDPVRREVRIESGIVFAVVGDTELRLDLYLPAVSGPPVVVYLHGGGWVTGDRADDTRRLRAMAEAGIAVASIDYRLAPAARHPAQVHDAQAAIAWLRRRGAGFGLSTARIGVWGASAGGYIATMAGLMSADAGGEDAADAVVAWFTLGDMAASVRRTALEKVILPPPFEAVLLGLDDPDPAHPRVAEADPQSWASKAGVPFLIAHGDRDQVVPESQGRALHDALVRAGGDSTLMVLGGAGHEDERFDRDPVIGMTAAWLLSRLS